MKIREFDTIKYNERFYFLIGSDVTSSKGIIEDPIFKFKVFGLIIDKLDKNVYLNNNNFNN